MIKITIIGWILFLVMKFMMNFVAESLSEEEKQMYKLYDKIPARATIVSFLWLVIGIADVVLTIVTIANM